MKEYRIKEVAKNVAQTLLLQSKEDVYAVYVDKTTEGKETLALLRLTDCSVEKLREIFNIEASDEVCEVRFFTMEYVPEINYND